MATDDKEAAMVLNIIPESGATQDWIAKNTKLDKDSVAGAVNRLDSLRLIQRSGDMIFLTPGAAKARGLFTIV